MKASLLRSNLFRFEPSILPPVFQYAATEGYRTAWQCLFDYWESAGNKWKLPTSTLEELIAAISGGPAWIHDRPGQDHEAPAIVTLRAVDAAVLNQVLHLWALDILRRIGMPHLAIPHNLLVKPAALLWATDLIGQGRIHPFAYRFIPWMVAASLERAPLESTIPLPLCIASTGELLAWDSPIVAQEGAKRAIVLHSIRPSLVLLHHEPSPLISIRVHLANIATHWKQSIRHVWLKRGKGVVKLEIYRPPKRGDLPWQTLYSNPSGRLLEEIGYPGFPALDDKEVSPHDELRPICKSPQRWPLIAAGAGPLFLDQACWHLRRQLPSVEPMIVERAIAALRTPKTEDAGHIVGATVGPILVVSATGRTAVRVDAAKRALAEDEKIFVTAPPPQIDLHYLTPSDAHQMLCEPIASSDLARWFAANVVPEIQRVKPTLALVETSSEVASGPAERDPKFPLRRLFAEQGIGSQFILAAEPDATDYAAQACLFDLIRQSGTLPNPAPRIPSLPTGTTVIAVYLDRIKTKGPDLLPVITRLQLGSQTPELFWHDPTTGAHTWLGYREGIAKLYASPRLLSVDEMKLTVTRALATPTEVADEALIVYLHSHLRNFYGGLKDSGGTELPKIGNNTTWVVRIRSDQDTAQMSGDQSVQPDGPAYIKTKIGLYRASGRQGLYYFVSPSKQYGKVRSQRENTRFDITGRDLKDPWQQLGVTEMAIIRAGTFASELDIAHQTALLCRRAPTWDGHIRLPSPMHLAMQVAGDHPAIEIHRRSLG